MSLRDLSDLDFTFYRNYAKKMMDCHESEFVKTIDCELMRAYYRGRNSRQDKADINSDTDQLGFYSRREHFLTYSRIFQASNTILPNLYYQNPSPIVLARKDSTEDDAALMTAVIKYYMKLNEAKRKNQEAILNAWFFGLGWKKHGYHTSFLPQKDIKGEPESKNIDTIGGKVMQMVGQGMKSLLGVPPDNLETPDGNTQPDYETMFNDVESPMNIMLDHKADLYNGKAILHRVKRTLYDLECFGSYDPKIIAEIYEKMKYNSGTRLDSREIELDLNELHTKQRNGTWITTWVDQFPKAMKYDRSTYQGKTFQFTPIMFTNEPGVRYPISHMKVATQIQEHLDYLATLYVRIVDRVRNMTFINEKDLAPGSKKAIQDNLLGGIVFTNKPLNAGSFANVNSSGVTTDIPNLMSVLQQNITEIMGTDEQIVAGASKNKTLGQDKLANIGTQIRESGMLDRVRDFMIAQFEKEGQIIKEYSNAELHFQITGKDYSNPQTGQKVEEKWVEFMTQTNPLGLKQYLQGEFEFDCNIQEAPKPDSQSIQKECTEAIQVFSDPNVKQAMLDNGTMPRIDVLAKKLAEQFFFIKDSEFIEKLSSQQLAAIQAKAVMAQAAPQMLLQKQKGQQEIQKQAHQQHGQMVQQMQQQAAQPIAGGTAPND